MKKRKPDPARELAAAIRELAAAINALSATLPRNGVQTVYHYHSQTYQVGGGGGPALFGGGGGAGPQC